VANGQVGIVIPQAEISIIRYRMPFIPDAIMIPILGTVNNSPFTILNTTYDTGNLLFSIGNTDTEADVLGNITYVVEYKFLYNPVGWQNLLVGAGISPIFDANGNPPYGVSNFNVLP